MKWTFILVGNYYEGYISLPDINIPTQSIGLCKQEICGYFPNLQGAKSFTLKAAFSEKQGFTKITRRLACHPDYWCYYINDLYLDILEEVEFLFQQIFQRVDALWIKVIPCTSQPQQTPQP